MSEESRIAYKVITEATEKIMQVANAFDLLILPILQCTAAIFAFFALMRLCQFALAERIEKPGTGEGEPAEPAGPSVIPFRPASAGMARILSRPINLSR